MNLYDIIKDVITNCERIPRFFFYDNWYCTRILKFSFCRICEYTFTIRGSFENERKVRREETIVFRIWTLDFDKCIYWYISRNEKLIVLEEEWKEEVRMNILLSTRKYIFYL